MAVKTDKGIIDGSSWFQEIVITTYPKLIEILGQPTCNTNTGEDKVNMECLC